MEISKQPIVARDLAASLDPRDLSYKVIGIITWGGLILYAILAVTSPRTALVISRVIAIYMLIRFTIVAIFYLVGLVKIRLTKNWLKNNPIDKDLTEEQKVRLDRVHHVVVIPNYKEPLSVLELTLNALANQPKAHTRLTVVLAMEEAESEAPDKVAELSQRFEGRFAHLLATYHPSQLPGEIPGKAANQSWAARQARRELVDELGMQLEDMTVTSCDADSVFHPRYFDLLGREFILAEHSDQVIWQSPLTFDLNIWHAPASIRLLTYFSNAVQISELANPLSVAFPISTYSLSFKLLDEVDYWDPAVISEDWHMFLRCFFAKQGHLRLKPIYAPTAGEPVIGENLWKTWENFYSQQVRHAWGAVDLGYMLQQWRRRSQTSVIKKISRFMKILHDNVIFSLGSVFILVGTLLSLALDRNPIITYPELSIPYVIEALNVIGVVGMLTIWVVERIRCSNRHYSWKLGMILSEVANWAIFAFLTLILAGLPILHAHTKMLFGSNLEYERTPKGLIPRQR